MIQSMYLNEIVREHQIMPQWKVVYSASLNDDIIHPRRLKHSHTRLCVIHPARIIAVYYTHVLIYCVHTHTVLYPLRRCYH